MITWFFGVIVGIIAISVKVLGTILQKRSHKNEEKSYCKNIHWVAGVCLTICGSLMDLGALALAPQSTIASLGGLTLVMNIILSRILLDEKMQRKQYITTGVILIGTTLTIIFAPRVETEDDIDKIKEMYESTTFLVYITMIGLIILGTRISYRYLKGNDIYKKAQGILMPISSGTIAAQNLFFGKTFTRLIRYSIEEQTWEVLGMFLFYINLVVLVFTIVGYVKWLNQALKEYRATLVVPINKSVWIIISIIAGLIVLNEEFAAEENESGDSEDSPEEELEEKRVVREVFFILGIVIIIIGLILHSHFEEIEPSNEQDRLSIDSNDDKNSNDKSDENMVGTEIEIVLSD